jgi:hypothetical protein
MREAGVLTAAGGNGGGGPDGGEPSFSLAAILGLLLALILLTMLVGALTGSAVQAGLAALALAVSGRRTASPARGRGQSPSDFDEDDEPSYAARSPERDEPPRVESIGTATAEGAGNGALTGAVMTFVGVPLAAWLGKAINDAWLVVLPVLVVAAMSTVSLGAALIASRSAE